jgi:hypothetical protein
MVEQVKRYSAQLRLSIFAKLKYLRVEVSMPAPTGANRLQRSRRCG